MGILFSPQDLARSPNMNTFTIVALACMAVFASAKPSGHGVVVSGPSGVVTGHGAVGPAGTHSSWDDGGHWDDGSWGGWDDGHWDGGHWGGHHSNVVHGNGAVLVGPSAGHAVLAGPAVGHGGWGAGGWGGHGGWAGGHGGWVGGGWAGGHGHGVVVKGPPTVPATIVGPAGKVHAEGLWGPTHAHGHGGHW